MTKHEAGRELDALIAERVMGLERAANWLGEPSAYIRGGSPIPAYSTDIAAAMEVVAEVQRRNPGWRFALLGGDVSYGYFNESPRCGVDEKKLLRFGWSAEFFGHIDPRENYGDRHGEAHNCATAPLAICLAALEATKEGPA